MAFQSVVTELRAGIRNKLFASQRTHDFVPVTISQPTANSQSDRNSQVLSSFALYK